MVNPTRLVQVSTDKLRLDKKILYESTRITKYFKN